MNNRTSIAALAVIQHDKKYLVRYNKKSECYFFIGGHVKGRESYKQSLVREIAEETAFEPKHYKTLTPATIVQYQGVSKSTGVMTDYTMSLHNCLLTYDAINMTMNDSRLMWISAEDIKRGIAPDGKPISADTYRIISQSQQVKL